MVGWHERTGEGVKVVVDFETFLQEVQAPTRVATNSEPASTATSGVGRRSASRAADPA
jgi:hypothetical protein